MATEEKTRWIIGLRRGFTSDGYEIVSVKPNHRGRVIEAVVTSREDVDALDAAETAVTTARTALASAETARLTLIERLTHR